MIPIGPQLQSKYHDPQLACDMHYLHEKMQQILAGLEATSEIPIIEDIAMGWDYLNTV